MVCGEGSGEVGSGAWRGEERRAGFRLVGTPPYETFIIKTRLKWMLCLADVIDRYVVQDL